MSPVGGGDVDPERAIDSVTRGLHVRLLQTGAIPSEWHVAEREDGTVRLLYEVPPGGFDFEEFAAADIMLLFAEVCEALNEFPDLEVRPTAPADREDLVAPAPAFRWVIRGSWVERFARGPWGGMRYVKHVLRGNANLADPPGADDTAGRGTA